MDGNDRRNEILEVITTATSPVTATKLAEKFGVSRQVIVQDVALLRAAGNEILATPQGYLLVSALMGGKVTKTFACKHDWNEVAQELYIVVDNGGEVVDVIVEHPLYGELKGMLMLASRRDVEEFVQNLKETQAQPLSALTGGVHLHTVKALDEESMKNIEQALMESGILLNK